MSGHTPWKDIKKRAEPRTATGQELARWFTEDGMMRRDGYSRERIKRLVRIEREAIADFLDHDLPGLLAEVYAAVHADVDPIHLQRTTMEQASRERAAALIAAIRSRLAETEARP